MANEQNLRPGEYQLSQDEAKKGGVASGAARRAKRDLRLALEALLERDITDKKSGKTMTGTEALAVKLFDQALKGNIKAFGMLRDTVGQKPVDKVMVADVDAETLLAVELDVEAAINGGQINDADSGDSIPG